MTPELANGLAIIMCLVAAGANIFTIVRGRK